MLIVIKSIPHKEQRYDTCGDYWVEKDSLQVRISKMKNGWYFWLILLHELFEIMMCLHRKINFADIDKFDIAFEKKRKAGNVDEPGDDKRSPYMTPHCFATAVERMACACLDLSWKEYDDYVAGL